MLFYTDEVTLNSLAHERGFSVRDVPRDGNCLISAVAVQLDRVDIQLGETSLREQLVEHLQPHPYTHDGSSHFREFLSAPITSDDPSNADTEAPSEQDEYINSIEDPQLRQQLRWHNRARWCKGRQHGTQTTLRSSPVTECRSERCCAYSKQTLNFSATTLIDFNHYN